MKQAHPFPRSELLKLLPCKLRLELEAIEEREEEEEEGEDEADEGGGDDDEVPSDEQTVRSSHRSFSFKFLTTVLILYSLQALITLSYPHLTRLLLRQ